MEVSSLFNLCKFMTVFAFLISFTGKAINFMAFQDTISQFGLIPEAWNRKIAILLMLSELAVVFLVAFGLYDLLTLGFVMANILLVMFTLVIIITLIRGFKVSCNCFGKTDKEVSWHDIVRNSVFILTNSVALIIHKTYYGVLIPHSEYEIVVIGLISIALVLSNLNIGHLAQLYTQFEDTH